MSLLAMLVIIIIVGGIASAFMLLTMSEARNSERERYRLRANYLAEAAVEQVAGMLQTGFANENFFNRFAGPTGSVTVKGYPNPVTYQITNTVVTTNPPYNPKDTNTWLFAMSGSVPVNNITVPFNAKKYQYIPPAGIKGQLSTYRHLIQIEVTLPYQGVLGYVLRDVELDMVPLFQFLGFYNRDLEFLPGPPFVGKGRLHSNGNLYIGAGSSIDMYTDHIQAQGLYRHRFNDGSYTENSGPVTIHDPNELVGGAAFNPPIGWNPPTPALTDWQSIESPPPGTTGSTVNFDSTMQGLQSLGVKDANTGFQNVKSPDLGALNPSSTSNPNGGIFFSQAADAGYGNGLVILDDPVNGPSVMTRSNGPGTPMMVDPAATAALTSSGVLTQTTLTDRRESQMTQLPTLMIDMGKLKTTSYYPSNGVLYAYSSKNFDSASGTAIAGSPGSPPGAIMITNGSDLSSPSNPAPGAIAPGSITIASNGPVYVQGDFNAPHVPMTTPTGAMMMSTNGTPMIQYDAAGNPLQDVSRQQAAAVIADAVNLLSNAWNPSNPMYKTVNGPDFPNATPTNYNFAMVTGIVESNPATGQYSGGMENLPRFQENWNTATGARVASNYRGAMVNLWDSQVAKQPWGQGGGVYNPPARNWDFDQSFTTPGSPTPPAFPTGVNFSRNTYGESFLNALGQTQ
jgi:hypothetical protein